jgi:hypothetical protein
MHWFHLAASIAYCILGIMLFAGTFLFRPEPPHWVRVAFRMAGTSSCVAGALGLTFIYGQSLSYHVRYDLLYGRRILEGATLGILLLVIFAGELKFPKKKA